MSKNCTDLASASPQLCLLPVLSGPRPLSWSLTPAMSWAVMGLEVTGSQAETAEFAVAQGDCTCLDWSVCSEVRRGPLTLSSVIIKKLICVVLVFFWKDLIQGGASVECIEVIGWRIMNFCLEQGLILCINCNHCAECCLWHHELQHLPTAIMFSSQACVYFSFGVLGRGVGCFSKFWDVHVYTSE